MRISVADSEVREKKKRAGSIFLPPIEVKSLPEHEAVSEAAALLLRCRLAERREASMALREIKDRIEREREPESESPSRLASHKRRKKPTQQLFCERCRSRRASLLPPRGLVSNLPLPHQRKTRPEDTSCRGELATQATARQVTEEEGEEAEARSLRWCLAAKALPFHLRLSLRPARYLRLLRPRKSG